ncbi:wd g-beta repeat-containing protein [Cystoisospora suis]|uniref:Dynein axonemal intermediate chain 4 n=1 Tax=Cystoisospora suis TaxID=483139 RepID=A0A2C6KFI9_9APIC|nr:wd g-beta repeat-containing protein [Cystoisospora suis]
MKMADALRGQPMRRDSTAGVDRARSQRSSPGLRTRPSVQASSTLTRSSRNFSQIRKSGITFSGNPSNVRNTKDTELAGGGQIHVLLNGKIVTPRPLAAFIKATNGDATDVDKILELAEQHEKDWRSVKEALPGHVEEEDDEEYSKQDEGFLYTPRAPQESLHLSEELLESEVEVSLQETPTEVYFSLSSLTVLVDTEEYWSLTNRNKQYDDLSDSKSLTEKYVPNHSQTLNFPPKLKEVSAVPPAPVSTSAFASPSDIFDAFNAVSVPRAKEIQQHWMKETEAYVEQGLKTHGSLLDVNKVCVQQSYQLELAAPSRRAGWGGVSDSGTSKDATAASIRRGSTTLKARRNDTSALPGLSKEPSRKNNGLSAGPSILCGGSSTKNGRRRRPSVQITGEISPTDEGRSHRAPSPGSQEDSVPGSNWRTGSGAPLPPSLSASLLIVNRILAQTRHHSQHMVYRNFFSQDLSSAGSFPAQLSTQPALRETTAAESGNADPNYLKPSVSTLSDHELESETRRSEALTDRETPTGEVDGSTVFPRARAREYTEEVNSSDEENDDPVKQTSPAANFTELFDFDGRALTGDMSISAVEWNPANQDLLAVGCGSTPAASTVTTPDGWILFWSLKNPLHPERKIHTSAGALSLHFSCFNPNLLASGLADGHVAIWDLRRPGDEPVLQSHSVLSVQGSSRHSDAVWDVRWVDRGPEKIPREQLLSIGGDGRVYQWTMKKVLERTTMMSIKHVSNPCVKVTWNSPGGAQTNDTVVFMHASGLCIDISDQDPSTYVIGTDEGLIHRCSTSYNEQYLDTYLGHTGPVNSVKYSLFHSDAFLSCSDDGMIRLWNVKQPEDAAAILPPSSRYSAVTDISWFALNCPVLVVGDRSGCATVLRVEDEEIPRYSALEQKERLQSVLDRQGKA